ncbi:MAG: hypothetical protein GY863_10305 [bacterium]|nr:hypothetical protein [bacterium]
MRPIITNMILTVFIICGCSETINYPEIPPDQKYLFEFEFKNSAWGWMHYGFFIDNEGNVYKFESPLDTKIDDLWLSNSDGYYTEEELLEKFEMLKEFVMQIDMDELEVRKERIGYASDGKLTDPENRMADYGIGTYRCYIYDSDVEKYREVVLLVDGDYFVENKSPDAKYLYNWMKTLHDENVYKQIDENK